MAWTSASMFNFRTIRSNSDSETDSGTHTWDTLIPTFYYIVKRLQQLLSSF
jgi:hypothetical protein